MGDKGAIGQSTATKIRDGKIVTPNSYFKLMKWLEKEKPEVYKEAMEHILKELGKLKMESNLPASRKREFSPVNVEKRETAIERLCMETASMAVLHPE